MCGQICIQPYASPGKALIIVLRRINNLLKLRLFTEWISNRETPIFLCLVLNKSLYYFSKNPLVTHYILTSKWDWRFARKKPFMINMQDEVLLSHHVSCLKEGSNPVFYILFNLHLNKCYYTNIVQKTFMWETISESSHWMKRFFKRKWINKISQKGKSLLFFCISKSFDLVFLSTRRPWNTNIPFKINVRRNFRDPNVDKNRFGSILGHPCNLWSKDFLSLIASPLLK